MTPQKESSTGSITVGTSLVWFERTGAFGVKVLVCGPRGSVKVDDELDLSSLQSLVCDLQAMLDQIELEKKGGQ